MIELQPMYDSRKSFYKKAHVLEENGVTSLISYNTKVAEIKDNKLTVFGTYSPTTLRHIKEFIWQNGFKVGTKDEIIGMYVN